MAPAYANLFMHDLESQLLDLAPVKPYLWLRYIDDIFMIWTAAEEQLQELLQWINQYHDTIKFTWDWSRTNVNYLDVQVINNNGVIKTDLYTKPTDKHQYLFHTSCHPKGCKESISYAQALRLRRICSTSATARKIAFIARQMCGQRFCKGLICTLLTIFDAHQRSSLNAPLPPRSKAVKAVFTHL